MTPLNDPNLDIALLRRLRDGDADAFTELYRRHEGPLYRFALMRCGAADAAADVVQEVFLALLNDALHFDPLRGAFHSFLFGVARNMLAKRYEQNRRYVAPAVDAEGEDDDIIDSAPAPLQRLLADETSEAVRSALHKIAAHYREVLILYEMHELTYVEIAQICDIDIGTVRSRLSRARSKLTILLAPLWQSQEAEADKALQ
jgi:RNA polymerase sigma-70 factor (ECF subfamily)